MLINDAIKSADLRRRPIYGLLNAYVETLHFPEETSRSPCLHCGSTAAKTFCPALKSSLPNWMPQIKQPHLQM